jgi:biotin-(acetyl-CoA carboxylase) ligase
MPSNTRARTRTLTAPELSLPPPFTLVSLREVGDAFAHATSVADEQGAGTLVYVGRFDLAEFAVVLEPEQPLAQARGAFYAGMAALADALATHAQPETAVSIGWPDSLLVNGGLVGGGRLGWPRGAREDAVPSWLVFGGMIRTVSMSGVDPGLNPLSTALEEEGFTDVLATQLVESFARHLMVALDAWQEHGFAAVARSYLEHLPAEKGVRRDIDENGDLTLRRNGMGLGKVALERKKLLPLLAKPAWLDPTSRGPRL